MTTLNIEWLTQIDSTNSELLRRAAAGSVQAPHTLVAALQTHGRGRAGRVWRSDVENLCLSMLLELPLPVAEIAPLTLALGVAARRALLRARPALGALDMQLKWPNDLYLNGAKLGGILLEVAKSTAQKTSPTTLVVAGIGVNLRLAQGLAIAQDYTDLACHGIALNARELAPLIAAQWLDAAANFAESGLRDFMGEWQAADLLYQQPLSLADDQYDATLSRDFWHGAGISARGGLLIRRGEQTRELLAGEVARAQHGATVRVRKR